MRIMPKVPEWNLMSSSSSQMGMDADQFNTMADETAKTTVKQELVLYAIKEANPSSRSGRL